MGIFNCVFVIIGVIIGAGFASGKEIYTFFFRYGIYGIIGISISIILIGIFIYKVLKIIKKYNINNYDELLDISIGKLETKNISIKIILNFIINLFLLITFFIMCAGFVSYFKQELGINEILASIISAVFCYLILNKDMKGVIILNTILIPLMIAVLIILGIKAFDTNLHMQMVEINSTWFTSAILYASYNTITLISILLPMKKYIKNKKDILKIVIPCIIIIALLASVVVLLLMTIDTDINKIEIPTVYAVRNFGDTYKYLYGIIIVCAIITTAISSGYGFLNNISKTKNKYKINNILMCILAIFVSFFGFSNLVNRLYPIFGILGLIQLILILKCK